MATHSVSTSDATLLLQIVGGICVLFSAVTATYPQYLFHYTLPLALAGTGLLYFSMSEKFDKMMTAGQMF